MEESQEEGEEKVEEKLTLRRLVKWKAFDHTERIEEISGQASGEAALETMIKGVEANWKTLDFPVQNHRDSADVFILGVTEDIQMACDDSRITVSTILSSRYVGPIREKVDRSFAFATFAKSLPFSGVINRRTEYWKFFTKMRRSTTKTKP